MISIIDTHCHIDFHTFDIDRRDVIDRAKSAGVKVIINPGVELDSCESVIKLSERFDIVYSAVGVHPNSTVISISDLGKLTQLLTHPKVIAIGEIGLDYYRNINSRQDQIKQFKLQLGLAEKHSLPVIIHNRQADEDLLSILSEWCEGLKYSNPLLSSKPGVLHSFSSGMYLANRAIELGFYLGISGPITYNKSMQFRDVFQDIPLSKVVVETDAPFLTPEPYRGRRNEPSFTKFIVERIAEIKSLPAAEVGNTTTENAINLFNLL